MMPSKLYLSEHKFYDFLHLFFVKDMCVVVNIGKFVRVNMHVIVSRPDVDTRCLPLPFSALYAKIADSVKLTISHLSPWIPHLYLLKTEIIGRLN